MTPSTHEPLNFEPLNPIFYLKAWGKLRRGKSFVNGK